MVLRRPPFGSSVRTAHDMGREVRILTALADHYDGAPNPVLHCRDESIIGAEFYIMERLRGVILRRRLPAGVVLDAKTAAALCTTFVTALADLHRLDVTAIGLGDFGRPDGYVRRQVEGWTARYGRSKTDDLPQVDRVAAWLADNLPQSPKPALIHNDFKFDNMVLDPGDLTRVLGVLDWEMATVGDPLMDLGTALSYWVESGDRQEMQMLRFGPTDAAGMLTRQQLVDRYSEATGRGVSEILFYYAFGLFKTAVVAQQIYYRFARGKTTDQRFAQFIFAVRILADQAEMAIESGGVTPRSR